MHLVSAYGNVPVAMNTGGPLLTPANHYATEYNDDVT